MNSKRISKPNNSFWSIAKRPKKHFWTQKNSWHKLNVNKSAKLMENSASSGINHAPIFKKESMWSK